MPQIKLQAKLQAYSRMPISGEYILRPEVLTDNYSPEIIYAFKDNAWVDIIVALEEKGFDLSHIKSEINRLSNEVSFVKCYINDKQQLVFVDHNENMHFYTLPGANVDDDTIGLDNLGRLKVLDRPDNASIKIVDIEYEELDPILETTKKVSGTLRADALYVDNPESSEPGNYISGYDIETRLARNEKNISDLESYIQGKGGFLDPYYFGNLREQDINQILTEYAYSQLHVNELSQIPDQTKVKNTFDGHIWVYIQEESVWIDEGADTVVTANNEGILGSVTGVEYDLDDPNTKFKISIEKDNSGASTGKMSVNGLQEEFDQVIYNIDANIEPKEDTIAKRTENGTLRAKDSIDDYDLINQSQFNAWQEAIALSSQDINDIVNAKFNVVKQEVKS